MAYRRNNWVDHAVERPRTFNETTNTDGSVTHDPILSEVVQGGTPMNAKNFNAMEEALQHISVAFDLLFVTTQAQIRALQNEVDTLKGGT